MSLRTLLVVVLALVCGGAAAMGVGAFVRNQRNPLSSVATVSVVLAAGDIARLGQLSTEQLVVREVPKDTVPAGALLKIEDAIGRVALVAVSKNDYILDQRLSKGPGRGAAAAIPKGMRAFMIPITKLAGAASGFLQPGDKVDVLLNIKQNINLTSGEPGTKVLLSRIDVFAVDQILEPGGPEFKINVKELRSVTLLVTQAQALELTAGMSDGTLQLILRNADEEVVAEPLPPPPPVVKEKPAPIVEPEPNPIKVAVVEAPPVELPPAVIRTIRGHEEGEVRLIAGYQKKRD